MKQQNDLDKLFRTLSEEKQFPYKEAYWEKVASQLPDNKRGGYYNLKNGMLLMAGMVIIIASVLFYQYYSSIAESDKINDQIVASNEFTENSDSKSTKDISSYEQQSTEKQQDVTTIEKSTDFANHINHNSNIIITDNSKLIVAGEVKNRSNNNHANLSSDIKGTKPSIQITSTANTNTNAVLDEAEAVVNNNRNLLFINTLKSLKSYLISYNLKELEITSHLHTINFKQLPANYIAISLGSYAYPTIQIKGYEEKQFDISPYLQFNVNKRISNSEHWSLNTGIGLNTMRIRGADSIISDNKYYSFGLVTYDSVQNLSTGFSTPQKSQEISQELLLQLNAPIRCTYHFNKRHSLSAGIVFYYLLNVRSNLGGINKTPSASLQTAETTEFSKKEWGYTSGINTWQLSAGLQYQFHIQKHFDIQLGINKMLSDISANNFYGNTRRNAPWVLNAGISYRLLNKY